MRSGSLFTGTAALDMAAAEIFGAQPTWCADLDPGAVALLAHHYPDLPNLGDITKVDWDLVAKLAWVYVLTLGWPCQPFSLAGKRKGADDERALWPECERAIRALRPRYLLLENVPAVVAAGELERVATSLATCGYRFAWVCLPAAAVGAPHIRERFFLLAVAEDADGATGGERWGAAPGQTEGRRARADARRRSRVPAADPAREHERAVAARDRRGQPEEPARNRGALAADAARDGREQGRPESARVERRPDAAEHGGAAADADRGGRGLVERGEPSVEARDDADGRSALDWAGYTPAILRWEAILGRPAPAPTVVGARGGRVLNPALPEWMMGLPDGWITTVPGLTRAQQLKLAGNGVVKHQAVAAYRYLLDVLERDSATQEKSA
jgi:DNA (cytosine-5)-methyltransferase 1